VLLASAPNQTQGGSWLERSNNSSKCSGSGAGRRNRPGSTPGGILTCIICVIRCYRVQDSPFPGAFSSEAEGYSSPPHVRGSFLFVRSFLDVAERVKGYGIQEILGSRPAFPGE
jgi:hypothetical protein